MHLKIDTSLWKLNLWVSKTPGRTPERFGFRDIELFWCVLCWCVDVAVQQLMETQTDGQRNFLELNAAGILWLSPHQSMNWFSVDLTANDKSCTISHHVSNGSLNGACYCVPFTSQLWNKKIRHVNAKCNDLLLSWTLRQFLLHFVSVCSLKEKQTDIVTQCFSFPFLPSSPGSPSLSGTGTVTVLVDDVNDNVPVFTSSTFHTTIMEDAPTGTDVLLVNSSDADVGVNGVIRYL